MSKRSRISMWSKKRKRLKELKWLWRLKKSRIQEVDDIREAKKSETFEKSKRESGPRAVSGQRSQKLKDVRGSEIGRFNWLKI